LKKDEVIKSSLTQAAHLDPAVQAEEPMTAKDEGASPVRLMPGCGARFLPFILS
jgi:hypothetical protein